MTPNHRALLPYSWRNTDGPLLRAPLMEEQWQYPPGESQEEMCATSLLLTAELRDAQPWRNNDAYLRHRRGSLN